MLGSTFLFRLAVVTGITAAVLGALYLSVPAVRIHGPFIIATLLLFMLICTGLYAAGRQSAQSRSKSAFIGLISASVFGKMVVSMAFLLAYRSIASPPNEWYVGIFLLVYVVYTVFEVWFMTRLGRT